MSLVNLREIVCGIYVFNTESGLCEEGVIESLFHLKIVNYCE